MRVDGLEGAFAEVEDRVVNVGDNFRNGEQSGDNFGVRVHGGYAEGVALDRLSGGASCRQVRRDGRCGERDARLGCTAESKHGEEVSNMEGVREVLEGVFARLFIFIHVGSGGLVEVEIDDRITWKKTGCNPMILLSMSKMRLNSADQDGMCAVMQRER